MSSLAASIIANSEASSGTTTGEGLPFQDGKIPFSLPSLDAPCQTYYKVFGDLQDTKETPLLVLHGGPGSGHEYMLPFQKLWTLYGIPVIFYDQIGCAGSTHYRDKAGDHSFWTLELFVSELETVVKHFGFGEDRKYDVLGHSFGGMLAAEFAGRRPAGLRRLILSAPGASLPGWIQGQWDRLHMLTPQSQQAIRNAVRDDDFDTKEYEAAQVEWAKTFWSRGNPWPGAGLAVNLRHQANDPTVRGTIMGKNYWKKADSLNQWTCIPSIPRINVPTFVYNGEFDSSGPESVAPFFDNVPKVRLVTLAGASHMHHLDTPELEQKVLKLVGEFLQPDRILKE